MRSGIPAFVLSLLSLCAAFGQAVTGTILGTVEDPTGARVPGVSVVATNILTGEIRRATTDAGGQYLFPALPVGEYRVEAEAAGFKKTVREGIRLDVNQNARVDLSLPLGSVAEEVRVTGDAALVDTHQVQVGAVVDSRRVNDLPLNGRNVYDLVSILPGVASTHFQTVQDNSGNYLNVNGSRSRHSTFLLDGAFNNDLWRNSGNAAPNPDAVEQFRLITSNFNAEFGRSPGAVFNIVTRSGTNQLHATFWEFLRNSKLNARNFFRPTVAPLRQNQFGVSAGGPIFRNKTFFFGSWQGLRIRSNAFVNSATTPTAAERTGDFSAAPARQRPVDPLTKAPFPGGVIPPNRLDPVAMNIIRTLVPPPNTADGRLEAEQATRNNEDQVLAKIDHHMGAAHKLYGSMFLVQGSGFDPFPSGTQIPNYAANNTALHQRNAVINEDWIASPAVLNQARFSYTRRSSSLESPIRTSWNDFGSAVKLGSQPPRPPQLFINGRWQMGTFGESNFVQQTLGWSDTISYIRNRHSLKAGAWVLYNRYDETGNWLGSGQVRFTGSFTGNTLADFMLGQAATFRQNNGQNRHFRSKSLYCFVQDDWQVHRKITLNLGLRYELNTPFVSTADELGTFRFGARSQVIPKAPLGMLYPGDPGVPRGIAPLDKNDLAPRVGISIDPFGNGKTAIRAGYGVFYAIGFANVTSDLQGQPFLVDVTVFGTPNLVHPYADVPGGSPFPYKLDRANPIFSLPVSVSYLDEAIGTPYVQHYSLTLDQQLTGSLSVQAAYVGNTSRKLIYQRDANTPVFTPGRSTAGNVNARRPYWPGTFAQIAQTGTGANAHYDSLQLVVNKRFTQGFSIAANYTFSKSIDEISDDKFNPTAVALVDSNNRRLDRAVSDFNTPHVFVISYVWDLPKPPLAVLGGWQLNGFARLESGSAINVTTGRDTNLDGNNTDRPNIVADPRLGGSRSRDERIARYFNTAAFVPAPDGSGGDAGRNLLYGPGSFTWNASIFKKFLVTERHQAQFRAEFFSLLNHANLGNPNGSLNSPNFGRILSAGGARVVQFGLKYLF